MKIKLVALINLLFAMSSFAQVDVLVNPISPFFGHINGNVEVGVSNAFSINTKVNKTYTHAQILGKDCYDDAMFVNVMPRLYFNKTKNLKGLYGNLMFEYGEYKNKYVQFSPTEESTGTKALEEISMANATIPSKVIEYQLKRGNVGVALGYKFLILSRFVIDGHIGYLRNVYNITNSDNEQSDLDNYVYEFPNELSTNITIGYRLFH